MKFLCTILAFLVLTLSVQPVCADKNGSSTDCCSEHGCAGTGKEDAGENGHEDCVNCNPFQLCGCCAFSIVPPIRVAISFNEAPCFSDYFWPAFCCPFIEEPVLAFWQPPKIA